MEVTGFSAVAAGTLALRANATAYTSGKIIAQSTTAAQCSAIPLRAAVGEGRSGMVRRVRLKSNDTAWLNATVRVHFFRDAPVFTNGDAGNFAAGLSESNYLGYADVTMDQSFSDPMVKGVGAPAAGAEINFDTPVNQANIYAALESRSSVTVAVSKTFTVAAEVLQN